MFRCRARLGAHHGYTHARAAFELLEIITGCGYENQPPPALNRRWSTVVTSTSPMHGRLYGAATASEGSSTSPRHVGGGSSPSASQVQGTEPTVPAHNVAALKKDLSAEFTSAIGVLQTETGAALEKRDKSIKELQKQLQRVVYIVYKDAAGKKKINAAPGAAENVENVQESSVRWKAAGVAHGVTQDGIPMMSGASAFASAAQAASEGDKGADGQLQLKPRPPPGKKPDGSRGESAAGAPSTALDTLRAEILQLLHEKTADFEAKLEATVVEARARETALKVAHDQQLSNLRDDMQSQIDSLRAQQHVLCGLNYGSTTAAASTRVNHTDSGPASSDSVPGSNVEKTPATTTLPAIPQAAPAPQETPAPPPQRELKETVSGPATSEVAQSFRFFLTKYDHNNTGVLTTVQFRRILLGLGSSTGSATQMSDEQIAAAVREVDPHDRGTVNEDAFVQWVNGHARDTHR